MSSCSGNCSSCGSDCADRKAESLLAPANPKSSVKKVKIAQVTEAGRVNPQKASARVNPQKASARNK